MALASGLASQIGFGAELTTTVGTRATPTRFLDYVSESLKLNVNRIESRGLRNRRIIPRWAPGVQWVDGGFELEMGPYGTGLLLKHAFGSVSTTGSSPYTHTFTPGDMASLGLTIQVGRPDISGTVRPFDYLGCAITDWTLTSEIDQYLMGQFNVYGQHEDTSQSLASASYPATSTPFVFNQGTVTVAGSAFDVKSFSISGNNSLVTGRHQFRTTTPTRPKHSIEGGYREYTGELVADFTDLTAYNRFVNGTEAALVLTHTISASASLTITCNVRYDGQTPNVAGPDLLELTLPFKCVPTAPGNADSTAITAVLVNSDSTP